MEYEDLRDELVRFHADLSADFFREWMSLAEPDPSDPATQYTAHELIKHASLVYRYTGVEDLVERLEGLPAEARNVLLIAGYNHIDTSAAAQSLDRIRVALDAAEPVEDATVKRVEGILLARDGLGAFIRLADRIARLRSDNPDLSMEVFAARADAITQVRELDAALLSLDSVTSVAAAELAGLRAAIKTEILPQEWWLRDVEAELDARDAEFARWLEGRVAPGAQSEAGAIDSAKRFVERIVSKLQAPLPAFALATAQERTVHFPIEGEGKGTLLVQASGEQYKISVVDDGRQPEWVPDEAYLAALDAEGLEIGQCSIGLVSQDDLDAFQSMHGAAARIVLCDVFGQVLAEVRLGTEK